MLSLVLALAVASEPCGALPGAERLWSQPQARIALVGEVHGARQPPQVAGALLCETKRVHGPTVLALEAHPDDGQAQIDVYLASDGGEAARQSLLAAPMWSDRWARASEAVFELVEAARRLGAPVVLFDTRRATSGPTDGPREQAMAQALAEAAKAGRVVALTGLGHADRGGFTSLKLASAAQRLPQDAIVTLAPLSGGGQAWACPPGAQDVTACGPRDLPVRPGSETRALRMDPTLRPGFDGLYAMGEPFVPSPPARH